MLLEEAKTLDVECEELKALIEIEDKKFESTSVRTRIKTKDKKVIERAYSS